MTTNDPYQETGVACDLAVVANLDTARCGEPLTAERFKLRSCPTCPNECVSHQACLHHAQEVTASDGVDYEKAP